MNNTLAGLWVINEVGNLHHPQNIQLLEKRDDLLEQINQTKEIIDRTSQIRVNPHSPHPLGDIKSGVEDAHKVNNKKLRAKDSVWGKKAWAVEHATMGSTETPPYRFDLWSTLREIIHEAMKNVWDGLEDKEHPSLKILTTSKKKFPCHSPRNCSTS